MSAAASFEAIQRGVAAALDGKDQPYKANESYAIDEERATFLALAARNVMAALKMQSREEEAARRAERSAKPKPQPMQRRPKPDKPQRAIDLKRMARTGRVSAADATPNGEHDDGEEQPS